MNTHLLQLITENIKHFPDAEAEKILHYIHGLAQQIQAGDDPQKESKPIGDDNNKESIFKYQMHMPRKRRL